jgi:hypothetical protein
MKVMVSIKDDAGRDSAMLRNSCNITCHNRYLSLFVYINICSTSVFATRLLRH